MQIWIRSSNNDVEPLAVDTMDTVQALKERIRSIKGIRVDRQRLFLGRREMKNCLLLADYNLRSKNSSLLPVASVCGAGSVLQMMRENQTLDLKVVQVAPAVGDYDEFIEQNAARVSYLRACQHKVSEDHRMLSKEKAIFQAAPKGSVSDVAASNVGASATAPGFLSRVPHPEGASLTVLSEDWCLRSAVKYPGSSDSSGASLATSAPSEDGSDLLSLSSSPPSSPCYSVGSASVSLEIEILKLAIPNSESCLDALTRENSERSAVMLKRLRERRVAVGF